MSTQNVNNTNAFDLKCLSLNVRGLNKSIKRRSIFRWLHKQKLHIIFLQESYSSKDLESIWEKEWGEKAFFSHGTNRSKGVITLINPSVDFKVEKCIPDTQGRFIILKVVFEEKAFVFVNIYAPNDVAQQTTFFNKLSKQLEEFAQETIIINYWRRLQLCTLVARQKRRQLNNKKSAVIKEINALCDLYNLNDIWRNLNREKQNFTWRTKSFKIQCWLDYFLISNELVPFANNCDIFYAPKSDHSAVSIHLKSNLFNHKRGPGFWKFNTTLLIASIVCLVVLNENDFEAHIKWLVMFS